MPSRGPECGVVSSLLPRERAFGTLLAGTSGAAILAHAFGPLPLSFAAPFVVFPTAALLVGLILIRRRLHARLHHFASTLIVGARWGLGATWCYDAVRPVLKLAFGFSFNPYRAMPIFGQLITGRPPTDAVAIGAGWLYHFWNGISFGMMFALVRPQGGVLAGVLWAMILQGLMMAAYPSFLQARLDDVGFLITGIVGHALWGAVLGFGIRREGRNG